MSYVKLDVGILDSTIWREPDHVSRVWIAMLVLASPEGDVFIPIPGLADRARVTVEEALDALDRFKAPDPMSRTKSDEGRRVREIEGDEVGWHVLNYEKYRNKDHTAAERMRRYRERKKNQGVTRNVTESTVTGRNVTQAEAEAEAEHTSAEAADEVITVWNSSDLTKVRKLTAKRSATLSRRLKDPDFRDNWQDAIARINKSPFCRGEIGGWKANIDWFLRPDTINKILEGQYDEKTGSNNGQGSNRTHAPRESGRNKGCYKPIGNIEDAVKRVPNAG